VRASSAQYNQDLFMVSATNGASVDRITCALKSFPQPFQSDWTAECPLLSLSLSLSLSVWSYERACGRIGIVSSIRPPAARSTPVLLPRRRSRRKLLRGSRVASLSLALPQSLADHSFIHRLRSVDSTNIAAVSCLRAFLVILRPPHLDTA